MGKWFRGARPSPAMLVGVIARVFAFSGAAVGLPGKNTVSSNDIKKNVVKSKHLKDDKVKAKDLQDPKIKELDLINGWVPYGGEEVNAPAAFKDGFGVVHLEGGLNGEDSTSPNAFQLPAGLRPAGVVYEPAAYDSADPGNVYIQPNGFVQAYPTTWVSLEGVTFRAAD